ncbi:MAG: hypothetical protein JW779_12980 [Candidatus Thorarchaeota archaeon]|nr:hypothetical protein [Candidatus Thorarchaeota archaeon]
MNEKTKHDSGLVGISPCFIGQILFILLCVVPLGLFASLEYVHWSWMSIVPVFYGLIWTFFSYRGFSLNTYWLDSEFLMHAFPTVIFNIIYVVVIYGFYEGMISRRNTVLAGIASLVVPFLTSLVTNNLFLTTGEYVGPLPILFLLSLVLFYRIPGPEYVEASGTDNA